MNALLLCEHWTTMGILSSYPCTQYMEYASTWYHDNYHCISVYYDMNIGLLCEY